MSSSEEDELLVETIAKNGDTLLLAKNEAGVIKARYRVSSTELMRVSAYYHKVLTSNFSEGVSYRKAKELLRTNYGADLTGTPLSELVSVSLPLTEGLVRYDKLLTAYKLFLLNVHEGKLGQSQPEQGDWFLARLSSDIDLFAYITAVADQLDACHVLKYVSEEILKVQPMCSKRPNKGDPDSERYWLQLLYIAYIQRQAETFRWITGTLILNGFESADTRDRKAPWKNLPNNVEEEMSCRRDGLFNTILSVPNYLLKPYMQIDKSRPAICKLGWSNSPACDSFQLGESIRWLCRRKLASPNLTMIFATPDDKLSLPDGTPKAMIKVLKEFPDYQIDVNHNRCGIKRKLIEILDVLNKMVAHPKQVGLCLDCWLFGRSEQSTWSTELRPNSKPYKGNILKDLDALQRLKEEEQTKKADSDRASSASTTRRARISLSQFPPTDSVAASFDQEDDGSDTSDPAIVRGAASEESTLRKQPPKVCPLVKDHAFYAKVFAPENWTEKIWLTGDEKHSEQLDTKEVKLGRLTIRDSPKW